MKYVDQKAITKVQAIVIGVIIIVAAIGGSLLYVTYVVRPPPSGIEEIKIGMIYPLSGPFMEIDMIEALPFWLEEIINKEGGIESMGGAKVKIIWADNQGKADVTLSETERLIVDENVVLIEGCSWSSHTYVTQAVAARLKVPNQCDICSSPTLLQRNETIAGKWFFLNHITDDRYTLKQLEAVIGALESKGLKDSVKTYGVVHSDGLFEQTVRKGYLDAVADFVGQGRIDWEKVVDIGFHAPAIDLTSEILLLKEKDPDIVFLAIGPVGDTAKLVLTMNEQNYFPPITLVSDAGFSTVDFKELGGGEAFRLSKYFIERRNRGYAIDQQQMNPTLKKMYDTWMANYDWWSYYVVVSYKAIVMIQHVLEMAGSDPTWDGTLETLPEKIRDAYLKVELTADEMGGTSPVKFNPENGLNELEEVSIVQMLSVPDNPSETDWLTVWPPELASQEFVIPDPRSRGLD